MSEHTTIRLEKDGTVVAYFAPNFKVTPDFQNEAEVQPRHDDNPSRVRDLGIIAQHVTVQGAFEHSDEMPSAHKNDVQSLFGSLPVTPQDQVNRLTKFMNVDGGSFDFYDDQDQYTATSKAGVDWAAGVFPQVVLLRVRAVHTVGRSTRQYVIEMGVGVES